MCPLCINTSAKHFERKAYHFPAGQYGLFLERRHQSRYQYGNTTVTQTLINGLLGEEEGGHGAPKIINATDRHALRLGQSVLIRAFPPVAAGTERQAASKFNTRRRSCELEAQKDTVERRYVPRLIIRPLSFSP